MTIRIYDRSIMFVGDSDNDKDIELQIESDGLKFTGSLTTAFNVTYTSPPQILPTVMGTVAGFTAGGVISSGRVSTIDKFPFSTFGGTATDVGELSEVKSNHSPQSSSTDGFVSGGYNPGGSPTIHLSTIDKFPFSASSITATDVGDLSEIKAYLAGHSSETDGFSSGGANPDLSPPLKSTIDKFPFTISSGTATNVGDLFLARSNLSGNSSGTDGFSTGGSSPPNVVNIDKFPFSISSGTATDIGDLSQIRRQHSGQSSTTDGFVSSGYAVSFIAGIDKFPFSISSGTATDVGDLSEARNFSAGQSSSTDGFTSGGFSSPGTIYWSRIDKFPFSTSSGTATNAGGLSQARQAATGLQH